MCIFQTASRRYLLWRMLFAILFTLLACPQSVDAIPQRPSTDYQVSPQGSSNWAGYKAISPNNGVAFTEINMYFTVPMLKATPGKNTSVAIWAGVGGGSITGSQELVQAGIFS